MPMIVAKQYTFAASHLLPNHKGKCARLHGHNYRVEVGVAGYILNPLEQQSSEGMLLDFDDLDAIVKPLIDRLDHQHLNDVLPALDGDAVKMLPHAIATPTAEHLALAIAGIIDLGLQQQYAVGQTTLRLHHVRVWETDKAYAEWRVS